MSKAPRGGWELKVLGCREKISFCVRRRIFTATASKRLVTAAFSISLTPQHDSSPLTSSGLESQWRFSKSMDGVSEAYGVLDMDKVFVAL